MGNSASIVHQDSGIMSVSSSAPAIITLDKFKAEDKNDISHCTDDTKTTFSVDKEEKQHSPRYYQKSSSSFTAVAEAKDAKGSYDPRSMSLLETMLLSTTSGDAQEFNPCSTQLTVGDIVRVRLHSNGGIQVVTAADSADCHDKEGIIVEKISPHKVMIDFGDYVRECVLDDCLLLLRSDEFESGDKVEARPSGSNLYFVGKVIRVNADAKTLDVLMEGDDPDDIEYNILFENTRKLMSRRTIVQHRWKRAFMLVVAANFFKRIHFQAQQK